MGYVIDVTYSPRLDVWQATFGSQSGTGQTLPEALRALALVIEQDEKRASSVTITRLED